MYLIYSTVNNIDKEKIFEGERSITESLIKIAASMGLISVIQCSVMKRFAE